MSSAPATVPARPEPAATRWDAASPWLQKIGRWGAILVLASFAFRRAARA